MENPQTFEGWAVIELLGHSRELGYVTTQYFGNQAMFLIDVPEIPERKVILLDGEYLVTPTETTFLPKGSEVMKSKILGRQRLVSSAAIYSINPSAEHQVTGEIGGNGPILYVISIAEENASEIPF